MTEPLATPAYPLQLEGELDGDVSRWQWLVKWVLVIPHVIVLVFLWIAFAATSVVAFHPELSGERRLHEQFLERVRARVAARQA